ncbi:hypothetical protein [Listeria goaensis]|uniref:hypothetical protein n=1 Tax=Listeria goaensis TaxID=1649188 RepID=UPI001967C578|nr:hypothetical protein [Listeria goaensis]
MAANSIFLSIYGIGFMKKDSKCILLNFNGIVQHGRIEYDIPKLFVKKFKNKLTESAFYFIIHFMGAVPRKGGYHGKITRNFGAHL